MAKLAGVPDDIIRRAEEISAELSSHDISEFTKNLVPGKRAEKKPKKKELDEVDLTQMSLFDTVKDSDIIEELRNLDIRTMTPLDAMVKLNELQNKVNNRW